MGNYHSSVTEMWERFIESSPEYSETKYRAWYFCDNERCANELAALVSIGIKRATTSLMLWYENGNEVMPEVNDINIVTDWNGIAQCIVKTKKVSVLPFKNVDSEMAFTEGEGDKSLDYWRKAHVSFFERELKNEKIKFSGDTEVVFEEFEMIFK